MQDVPCKTLKLASIVQTLLSKEHRAACLLVAFDKLNKGLARFVLPLLDACRIQAMGPVGRIVVQRPERKTIVHQSQGVA